MRTEDYAVRLDAFEGPLDLLLHLITRAEVDLSAIALADITDQYLRHLERVERIDVDPAAEFLVMAATLIELKSRLLIPSAPDDDGSTRAGSTRDAQDPAAELVRQLLQYKRFREAAARLEERRLAWDRRTPLARLDLARPASESPDADEPPALDLEDLSLFDLVQAYARIAQTVVFERLGDHSVVDADTPIELHAADILERLRTAPQLPFDGAAPRPTMPLRTIFYGKRRVEIIGLFLAVLELVRQRAVRVAQRQGEPEPQISLCDQDPEQHTSQHTIQHIGPLPGADHKENGS